MRYIIKLILLAFIFTGCANIYNIQPSNVSKNKTFKVIPFANFTQTPMAGYRVAGISEGVLKSKNIDIKGSLLNYNEKDYTFEEINQIIKKSHDCDYLLTGYVNEYRYKTGIDGEPAVSVTLKLYDVKNKKYIWRGVASKTGWSYESLSTISQEIIDEMISDMLADNL